MDALLKLAFIGSHGVGKSTLTYALAARLKRLDLGLELVQEVARRCPLPINRGTTAAAQRWILHTQIAQEIVAAARAQLVLCDRSVLDNYVYLLLNSGPQDDLEPLLAAWIRTYSLLVYVPVLEEPSPDGLRSLDPSFQRAADARLREEIARRELDVITLRGEERQEWPELVEAGVLPLLRGMGRSLD